jgi:branched-chain amino acid transport system substrate-binding protein
MLTRERRSTRVILVLVLAVVVLGLGAATAMVTSEGGAEAQSQGNGDVAREGEASPEPARSVGTGSATSVPCIHDRLVAGALLPLTGDTAFLGAPGAAAVSLALTDINKAGGALGAPVVLLEGDSGDARTDAVVATFDSQLQAGASVFIGPWTSDLTVKVIDAAVDAGAVVISPANSSSGLTGYPDEGLYFRTTPSDAAQGAALAVLSDRIGLRSGVVIARKDSYGVGIAEAFSQARGSSEESTAFFYDPSVPNWPEAVEQVLLTNPEFVVVAGFGEASAIVRELGRQGLVPQDLPLFVTDGVLTGADFTDLPDGTMVGARGVRPASEDTRVRKQWERRIRSLDPAITTFAYAAEAYDAIVLAALAAQKAGCADGSAVAAALPLVSGGDGDTCASFAECKEIIDAGGVVDYVGVSGPVDFDSVGDLRSAILEVVEYVDNDRYRLVEIIGPIAVPAPS